MKLYKVRSLLTKRTLNTVLLASLLVCVIIANADHVVMAGSNDRIYDDVKLIPQKKVALLLGSNKYVPDGRENLFYNYRIVAVVDLFTAGKVEYVLISGDNGTAQYSEPDLMKQDLVKAGIASDRIYLDYAGFRTWDSVIRANKVFLEDDFVIVSQSFHNERALFIARANGINAIAFNARDVPVARSLRIWLRERLARVLVVIDAVVNRDPKFLGDTIKIGETKEVVI